MSESFLHELGLADMLLIKNLLLSITSIYPGTNSKEQSYYGWVIVAISLLNLLVLYGVWYSYSVFLMALSSDFGWNRTSVSSIFSVFMLVVALTGPIVGYGVDKLGPRIILSIGASVFSLGLFFCSKVSSITGFYLGFGLMVGAGGSLIGLVGNSRAISHWFSERRGLAAGIATAGIGLGLLIVVPMVQVWVEKYGWRTSFLMLSILTGILLIPMNLFFQKTGRHGEESKLTSKSSYGRNDQGHGGDGWRLIVLNRGTFLRAFWIFFAGGFVVQAVLIHQVAIATDAGFGRVIIATSMGILGLMGTLGRPIWGLLSDRIGKRKAYLYASSMLSCGLASIVLARECHSVLAYYAYAFFFGIGYCAIAPLNWIVAAELFAGNGFSSVYGFLFMGTGLGAAAGPLFSGFIYDWSAKYNLVFAAVGLTLLLSNISLHQFYSKRRSGR